MKIKVLDAIMPLTWWLQADTHFNEDDLFQQNLTLTLQALSAEKKEEDCMITINIHKEIQYELNTIYEQQIETWLNAGMVKTLIFTTGKGDILLRQLFATPATSFVEAQEEGLKLKKKLQDGYFKQFALNAGSNFIQVSLLGVNDFSMPVLRTDVGKVLVLMITTEDATRYAEIPGKFIKDCVFHLRNYKTEEVTKQIDDFYALNSTMIPDQYVKPDHDVWDINNIPDIEMLELFE